MKLKSTLALLCVAVACADLGTSVALAAADNAVNCNETPRKPLRLIKHYSEKAGVTPLSSKLVRKVVKKKKPADCGPSAKAKSGKPTKVAKVKPLKVHPDNNETWNDFISPPSVAVEPPPATETFAGKDALPGSAPIVASAPTAQNAPTSTPSGYPQGSGWPSWGNSFGGFFTYGVPYYIATVTGQPTPSNPTVTADIPAPASLLLMLVGGVALACGWAARRKSPADALGLTAGPPTNGR